jgi:ParB-like nuclease domain
MNQNKLSTLKDFIAFCKGELNIQSLPKISLIKDRSFVEQNRSYGEYNPQTNSLKVFYPGRNLADICRSLAHELCHHRQNELDMIYNDAGETGTDIENDANAMAGIIMRDYGKKNVAVYDLGTDLNEEIKVALYPGNKGVDVDSTANDIKNAPKVQIPLEKLFRNEPAKKMKSSESIENIKNLAAMYKKGKKIDPILVRKKGSRFQILDGHHRFTAAKLAGLKDITAIIVPDENITPVDKDGNLLSEIGEGTKTYAWKFNDEDADGNYFYSFDTDNSTYSVGVANLEDGMYDLSFNTTSLDGDPDVSLDTNEGVPLRVLSTVVDIAKDFINKADPEIVIFRPIKTKEANKEDDQRRFKVYGAYLRKNLPSNYNLMTFGDTYRIVKK